MTVTFGKQPQGKFVFKKQSKIRWRSLDSPSEQSSVFVCGSWDDNVSWVFFRENGMFDKVFHVFQRKMRSLFGSGIGSNPWKMKNCPKKTQKFLNLIY